MSLASRLHGLGLLPASEEGKWPVPELSSSTVHYLRACRLIGHEAEGRDVSGALRELRYGCEDEGRAKWAWEDPSLAHLRMEHNADFARVLSPASAFVQRAGFTVTRPGGGTGLAVVATLELPRLSVDTIDPGLEVEVGSGTAVEDRDEWQGWTPMRWRPASKGDASGRGVATYFALRTLDKGAILIRFRGAEAGWTHVGKDGYVANGLSTEQSVVPYGMAGNTRIVGPKLGGGGWQNVDPFGSTTYHRTQEAAANRASKDLRSSGGGELIVQGRDGRIRAKDTIPPATDPRRSRG